ncbi:MAG: hypothetical protein ACD_65C00157G0001, partial [uncultured bacterium]
MGGWLFYVLLIPIAYACYSLYNWFNKEKTELEFKITFPRIIAGVLLMILITGNAMFLVRNPSMYHGTDIYYTVNQETGEEGVAEISDPAKLTGNETLIAAGESGVEKTYKTFRWLPDQLKDRFEFPSFLDIQIGLLSKSIAILFALGLILLAAASLGFATLKKS